jgi:S-methylmethionine-dependent homocysteine/selenocysteine methylase
MNKVTILDGGMGQELLHRSSRKVTPMWSADVMLNEPQLVAQLHADFIIAGADVITLNTYTATPSRLNREGHLSDLKNLHKSAMQAAQRAKDIAKNETVKIAGCLPPLVASYKTEAVLPYEASLAEYRQLVELQAPSSDLFICETMSSISEAKAACVAAKESQKEVWLALSVKDNQPDCLRSGESLITAINTLRLFNPDAFLLNCSKPEAINSAWSELESLSCKVGAYANGFTSVENLYPGDTVKDLESRQDLGPEAYAKHALKWIENGATIVGGCCEIGPAHIAHIHQVIK